MQISVRNQLARTVKEVKLGAVIAEIIVQAADDQIAAAITKDAAEDRALRAREKRTVLVKSTSVMIQK